MWNTLQSINQSITPYYFISFVSGLSPPLAYTNTYKRKGIGKVGNNRDFPGMDTTLCLPK